MRGHLLVLLALLASAPLARANPMGTYGYTARGLGLGGAMTAVARSFDATYYNPAGLARVTDVELGLGLSVRRTFLTARHSVEKAGAEALGRVETARGGTGGALDLGLAAPIPLGEGLERVLFAGASILLPGTTLYAIRERPIEQPVFPFLEERNDRLVLNLALAAKWKWVMLGAGVSFLPAVAGRVDVDFTDGAGRSNKTFVDVGTSLSPNVGVMLVPVEGLSIGLTWRGENRLDVTMPVSAAISEKIPAIDLTVTSVDHSAPHEVALGAAWQGRDWMVAGDVTYALYRRFRASFPDVVLFSSIGDKTSSSPPGDFRDTWAVRLGGELRVARGVDVRAGASWVQSPVPAQEGQTNLLDGDRFGGSLGAGFDLGEVGGPPVTVDAAVSGGGFAANRDAKTTLDPANPGYPWIEGRGAYVLGALSVTVRF